MKVDLNEVIGAFDMVDDETQSFYNKVTGEVICLNDYSDEDESLEDVESNPDRYLNLPSKYEVDDYHIMEEFIWSLPAGDQQNQLDSSIRGRGAFRYFRDTVDRLNLLQQWYDFKDQSYRRIAIDWCESNGISYK
ncbi:hypothetical protein LOOC260_100400 [Paucilactobacillus hokkaidonensis JCM 18461]|uniref:Uncharacterized protein n=2 Tax=Paucilactobacillus hokkaidonensis TaxID=1193095 RepID=A0A0A1GUD7_9LACO|nr:UPF0158 family protein [Paucilactobacillus hokkaidonensis]KRO08816.1 hypothetical protein IV59_GL001090 [Paucilactobacillus hokkaidonensis]BAP84619.1 hypothetical protein LOOC260_100400 [Paucilactobacillus hokkaidonensis JCM 18461]